MAYLSKLFWNPSRRQRNKAKRRPPAPPAHHKPQHTFRGVPQPTRKPVKARSPGRRAPHLRRRPSNPVPIPDISPVPILRRQSNQHRQRHERHAPPPRPVTPRRKAPRAPVSVSSFNTEDYGELFGTQMSDGAGLSAIPVPGRAVRRGSTRESVRPTGLGGGTAGGEPDLVVIDGGQVGGTAGSDYYDTDALFSALHFYTRIGLRAVAVVPWWAFESGLSLQDKARLRTDMLRGRVMASPPTSRHELFVRDVARRFRAYIVTNGAVPNDLATRIIQFTPQNASFRPRNGPGISRSSKR